MDLLDGVAKHFDWGSARAIPDLTGRPPTGDPVAELWLGAHRRGPARVGPAGRPLDEVISEDIEGALGPVVARRFGSLPFLVKVLAAERPLSIQAHPSSEQAAAGHDREERAGIGRDDARRSFPDPIHKPELICALSRFRALYGFREPRMTLRGIAELGPGLDPLRAHLNRGGAEGVAGALRWLLTLDEADATELTDEVVAAATSPDPRPADHQLVLDLARNHPGDLGVVTALLLNPVVLEPGQALFLASGTLHSYVTGLGVEVMANSDNVLRGGLTSKPVDTVSLLEIVDTEPVAPEVQDPELSEGVARYHCPVPEFSFERIELAPDLAVTAEGPCVLLCTAGVVEAGTTDLDRGAAAWIPASDPPVRLSGRGTVFRASVGTDQTMTT